MAIFIFVFNLSKWKPFLAVYVEAFGRNVRNHADSRASFTALRGRPVRPIRSEPKAKLQNTFRAIDWSHWNVSKPVTIRHFGVFRVTRVHAVLLADERTLPQSASCRWHFALARPPTPASRWGRLWPWPTWGTLDVSRATSIRQTLPWAAECPGPDSHPEQTAKDGISTLTPVPQRRCVHLSDGTPLPPHPKNPSDSFVTAD